MGMCRYGISLWVCNLISHSLCTQLEDIKLNTRRDILYLQAIMYYFVYYITTHLTIFQSFSTTFWRFPEISKKLNVSQQFPKSSKYYQRWLKIEEDPKMFRSYTKKFKLLTISKDFRPLSEDMENMPRVPDLLLWISWVVYFPAKNLHIYIIIQRITFPFITGARVHCYKAWYDTQNVYRNFVRVGQKAVFVFVLS